MEACGRGMLVTGGKDGVAVFGDGSADVENRMLGVGETGSGGERF